jgi:hypothetical protein
MEQKEEAKEGATSGWNDWADFYQHAHQPGEFYRCVCWGSHVDCSHLKFSTF